MLCGIFVKQNENNLFFIQIKGPLYSRSFIIFVKSFCLHWLRAKESFTNSPQIPRTLVYYEHEVRAAEKLSKLVSEQFALDLLSYVLGLN